MLTSLRALLIENSPPQNRRLGWLCLAILAVILLVGLWPLHPGAANNVRWQAGTNGLRFPGGEARSAYDPGGVAFTPHPLTAPATTPLETGALTLELWVRPAKEPEGVRGRMLAVTDAALEELFYVGQWSTQLLVLVRQAPGTGKTAFRELDVPEGFKAGEARGVTITSDASGTAIYMDGQLGKRYPHARLLAPNDRLAGKRLFLGNSPDGLNPWAGEWLGLAVYGRAFTPQQVRAEFMATGPRIGKLAEAPLALSRNQLPEPPEDVETRTGVQENQSLLTSAATVQQAALARYDFSVLTNGWIPDLAHAGNALFVPARLTFQKPRLASIEWSQLDGGDALLNVAGFVPLGFGLALWLRRSWRCSWIGALLAASVVGAGTSVIIELLQVYLPMRDSSLADLVGNTVGTLLGAVLAPYRRVRRRAT